MNDLQKWFEQNSGRRVEKWEHYFEIYDRYLAAFRDTEVHVVEIGVSHGGSSGWRPERRHGADTKTPTSTYKYL